MKDQEPIVWVAIKTRQDFRAAEYLREECEEVFFPTRKVQSPGKLTRERAVIPHVLFVRSRLSRLLELESKGRRHPESGVSFWLYRYPRENRVQEISDREIALLRLLTTEDTNGCEIYHNTDFKSNEQVRITGGLYAGYTGHVVRVRKNKHVVVRIEGICLVMLPYLHPDLLEKIT